MNLARKFKAEYAPRLNAVKTDRYALVTAIICAFLAVLIVYSFIVRVQMYTLGVTLWEDEARLAENIVDRTMREMLTPPLVNLQTAPVLYLIGVKILTLLFGTSEAVLRISSFIAMIVMLIAQGVLLRRVFRVSVLYSLFSVAVSSVFLYFMQHSYELKPYIGDAAFVLIVLLGYYAYREGILGKGARGAIFLAAIFIVSMLFSSPAAFAIGACFIVEFILKCLRRDREGIRLIIISGVIFIAAFALNYFLWLKPIAENPAMVTYWDGFKFNFMVFRDGAMEHNYSLLRDMLEPVWHTVWLTLPLAVAGFVISLTKKNVYTLVTGVFLFLLLVASAIDKYPIANRLWLFVYVIFFIYAFIFIDTLRSSMKIAGLTRLAHFVVPVFFAFLLLAPNFSFPAYGKGEEWTLTPGDQAKPLIEYVRENIREGDVLYSYFVANKILKYENGYHTNRIGNVSSDNIIYGTKEYEADIELVVGHSNAYALFYHSYYPLSKDWYVNYVIEHLQRRGYMDVVMDVYHTPLYWFTDDLSEVRASADYSISELQTEDGSISGILDILNTGSTILAHDRFDNYGQLYVILREVGETMATGGDIGSGIVLKMINSPINPGESAGFLIEHYGIEPGEFEIELVAYREYAFSELGVPTIPVTIN